MIVFATSPDWSREVVERIGYLTDILTAHDATEQRVRLRSTPVGGLSFRAVCLDRGEASEVESAIWSDQAAKFLVPFWPDSTPLLLAVDAGDSVLSVDPDDRDFVEGGRVLVWRGHASYEDAEIAAVGSGSITLALPLSRAYTAGAEVVPLKEARLSDSQRITHTVPDVSEFDVLFSLEGGELTAVAGATPTQYEGLDLLEDPSPNSRLDAGVEYRRSISFLDSRTSIRTVDDKSGIAVGSRTFNWFASGRGEAAALRAFIHRRFGRAVPFWAPTYRNDLPLSGAAAGSSFDIVDVGYTERQFPDLARRHVAFIPPSGAIAARKVTAAADNGNGTETLTISMPLPAGGFPEETIVSFLTLLRLGADEVELRWSTVDLVEADLPIVELPREVPA